MKKFSLLDIIKIGKEIGVDWKKVPVQEFKKGVSEELQEHEDVIGEDGVKAGKIAHVHLRKNPKYYTELEKLEKNPVDEAIKKIIK